MLDSLPHSVRSAIRLGAEVAGYVFGVAGLFGLLVLLKLPLGQTLSLTQIGIVLGLAFIAGVVASQCLPWRRLKRTMVLGFGARAGLRAGLIAAFAGGAALTAAATIRATTPEFAPEEAVLKVRMWITLAVALAGILPGVFLGFLGGSLGAAIRERRLPASGISSVRDEPEPSNRRWLVWVSRGTFVFFLLGYLSPAIFLFRNPKPMRPGLVADAVHRFQYEKPEGFEEAEPGRFTIAARYSIPRLNSSGPIAISADGRLLAFSTLGTSAADAITVLEFDTQKTIALFSLDRPVERLAWLPDSSRLFYVTSGEESQNGVLDLASSRVIPLPRPKNRDIPLGQMFWWVTKEVAFFPPDEPPLYYDLDELLLWPLKESPFFKALAEPEKTRWTSGPRTSLAATAAWAVGISSFPSSIIPPPRKNPEDAWAWEGGFYLSFRDPAKSISQALSAVPLKVGDLLATTPDGSKLVLLSGGGAEILYFGLNAQPDGAFGIKMPTSVEQAPLPEPVAIQLGTHALCAVVYSPMLNPLTSKTVGPDRRYPKAVLRLGKWTGDTAEGYVTLFGEQIYPQDVVADVHTWDATRLVPSKAVTDPHWWSLATPLPTAGRAVAADLSVCRHLDLGRTPNLEPELLAFRFTDSQDQSPAPVSKPEPPPPPPVVGPTDEEIRAFVRRHHENESSGNVAAIMASYAPLIDYMGKSISHDQLTQEQTAFFKRWNRVKETVASAITVSRPDGAFGADYTVEYRHESDSLNKWSQGTFEIALALVMTPEGLQITRQATLVHKTGEGQNVAPDPPPPPKSAGMRQDFVGKYVYTEVKPTPVFTNRAVTTLTIRDSTWTYTINTRILESDRTPDHVRRDLKDGVATAMVTTYSGSVVGRSQNEIRLRIGSVSTRETITTGRATVHPRLKSKGEVWTFVRRGNGLVPEGQDDFFELQE